jgi:RHS repeat-associated protein
MIGASIRRTYDARNLMITASRANGVTSQNTYDELGRVVSMTHAGPSGVLDSQTYTYDMVGNRTGSSVLIAQSLVTQPVASAAYNVNNELSQFGSTTNTFDANGNLASSGDSGGITTYRWDSRNRLASITISGGLTTGFTYDFAGKLIQQRDAGPNLNLTKTFVLDDLTDLAFVSRSDGDQFSILAGRLIDDHIAVVHASGQVEYGLGDALNSTVATVDQGGAFIGQFLYEPFGQTTAIASTYPFEYTGRVPSGGTSYYYRARYYNPDAFRFMSEDVVGRVSGTNLYKYVSDSPLTLTDPLGTTPIYGNYCGPGNYPRAPINQTDTCCMKHDLCYDRIGASASNAQVPGVSQCDRALCACVRNASVGSPYEQFANTQIRGYFHCQGQQCQGFTIISIPF